MQRKFRTRGELKTIAPQKEIAPINTTTVKQLWSIIQDLKFERLGFTVSSDGRIVNEHLYAAACSCGPVTISIGQYASAIAAVKIQTPKQLLEKFGSVRVILTSSRVFEPFSAYVTQKLLDVS